VDSGMNSQGIPGREVPTGSEKSWHRPTNYRPSNVGERIFRRKLGGEKKLRKNKMTWREKEFGKKRGVVAPGTAV
jgi:hypothetical protein